jgi:hypothetical protein
MVGRRNARIITLVGGTLAATLLAVLTVTCEAPDSPTVIDTTDPCYQGCSAMEVPVCRDYPLQTSDDCANGCGSEHFTYPNCIDATNKFYACMANAAPLGCATIHIDAGDGGDGGILLEPDTSKCLVELCARDTCFAEGTDAGVPVVCTMIDGGNVEGGADADAASRDGGGDVEAGSGDGGTDADAGGADADAGSSDGGRG